MATTTFWTDVKNFFYQYKYVILILIFITAAIIAFKSYLKGRSDVQQITTILKAQSDSIDYYKDQNGKLHAQVISQQGSAEIVNAFYKTTIDSLANILNIKDKQILNYINIIDSTAGNFTTMIDTVIKHDTVKQVVRIDTSYFVNYADAWLKFNGTFKSNSNLFHGSYKIKDSLTFVTYNKKTGFLGLGPTQYYLNVFSANPNAYITNIKNFNILTQKSKPFGIGPTLVVSYMNGHMAFVPGIGIVYSLFRF